MRAFIKFKSKKNIATPPETFIGAKVSETFILKLKKKKAIQVHHIKYKKKDGRDWKVRVFKGEHYILTRIQWYCKKRVSKGFIIALKNFIKERKWESEEL